MRFTQKDGDREIPFIVVGTGGYPRLRKINLKDVSLPLPLRKTDRSEVTMNAYDDRSHGYVELTIRPGLITGRYYGVGDDGAQQTAQLDEFTARAGQHIDSDSSASTDSH